MARIANIRERITHEEAFDLVKIGDSQVWESGTKCSSERRVASHDQTIAIHGLRVDVVIDDSPEGQALGFANLLAGLKIDVFAGEKSQCGSLTLRKSDHTVFLRVGLRAEDIRRMLNNDDEDGVSSRMPEVEIGVSSAKSDGDDFGMKHAVTDRWARTAYVLARQSMHVGLFYEGPQLRLGFLRVVLFAVRTRDVQ